MTTCYKCDNPLTSDNQSDEHIILNACGGRLKSNKLLCIECNSNFGDSFDSELAKQTNDFANLLLIKRERGEPQPIKGKLKSTGEDYLLLFGGKPMLSKPTVNQTISDNNVELSIKARNKSEFKKIIEGLKRKFKDLDVDAVYKAADNQSKYLQEPITIPFTIGGNDVFKSITKTAINFFLHSGGDQKFIKPLIPYLDGKTELDVVWMHYPDNPIYIPQENEVSHVIRVVGNPNEGILYSYIEFFNAQCYIIKMSETYDGRAFDESYIYNVVTNEELRRGIPLYYSKAQLRYFFSYKDTKPFEKVKEKFMRTLSVAFKRQNEHLNNELIERAINNSLGKYPEGMIITEEMRNELIAEIMKEISPLVLNRFQKNDNDNINGST